MRTVNTVEMILINQSSRRRRKGASQRWICSHSLEIVASYAAAAN
jgi:hypothetical protein